jgi:hypothetical protein
MEKQFQQQGSPSDGMGESKQREKEREKSIMESQFLAENFPNNNREQASVQQMRVSNMERQFLAENFPQTR